MNLSFCSFASGSSGNCYLIKSRESAILIDAGISAKRIHAALEETMTAREDVEAVFVTHEHSDHIKGLKVLTKQNPGWRIFASAGTCRCLENVVHKSGNLCQVEIDGTTRVGDISVRARSVSHDAVQPVCYFVMAGSSKIAVVTDTGYLPENVMAELVTSDLIVIEANHEVNMLKAGNYPYHLKLRILGDNGHLSNETAGKVLASVMSRDGRCRTILLAHLSRENNFPQLALQTVTNILEENSFYPGKHMQLGVLSREGLSGSIEL